MQRVPPPGREFAVRGVGRGSWCGEVRPFALRPQVPKPPRCSPGAANRYLTKRFFFVDIRLNLDISLVCRRSRQLPPMRVQIIIPNLAPVNSCLQESHAPARSGSCGRRSCGRKLGASQFLSRRITRSCVPLQISTSVDARFGGCGSRSGGRARARSGGCGRCCAWCSRCSGCGRAAEFSLRCGG